MAREFPDNLDEMEANTNQHKQLVQQKESAFITIQEQLDEIVTLEAQVHDLKKEIKLWQEFKVNFCKTFGRQECKMRFCFRIIWKRN